MKSYMATSEFEPTPSEMDPTKRFFNDFHYTKDSYIDLYIASEKLIQAAYNLSDSQLMSHPVVQTLPTSDKFEKYPDEARDAFLRVPLSIEEPIVDAMSKYDQFKAWYDRVATQIIERTSGSHSRSCVELDATVTADVCGEAGHCNFQRLAAHLLVPIMSDDFQGVEYVFDPTRQKELTIAKLEVARSHGLTSVAKANQYRYDYIQGWEYFFKN